MKLEGSDHIPVYTCLERVDDILQHNTPPLASRYLPMIIGQQQTLGMRIFILPSHDLHLIDITFIERDDCFFRIAPASSDLTTTLACVLASILRITTLARSVIRDNSLPSFYGDRLLNVFC